MCDILYPGHENYLSWEERVKNVEFSENLSEEGKVEAMYPISKMGDKYFYLKAEQSREKPDPIKKCHHEYFNEKKFPLHNLNKFLTLPLPEQIENVCRQQCSSGLRLPEFVFGFDPNKLKFNKHIQHVRAASMSDGLQNKRGELVEFFGCEHDQQCGDWEERNPKMHRILGQ